MIEHEYKFLLSKEQFDQVIKKANVLYSNPKKIVQVNQYYDDKYLSLNRRGITVRIRQINGKNKLEIKQHNKTKNKYVISEEFEYAICNVPKAITLPEYGRLAYKGFLTTHRSSYTVCPDVTLNIDENTYFKVVDFEVEIEFASTVKKKVEEVISSLNLETVHRTSKSERFFVHYSINNKE